VPGRFGHLSQWFPADVPPYNYELPHQMAEASRIVAQNLAPDAPFIGSNIILAAETDRMVPAELMMGAFSYTAEMLPEQAARLHLATRAQLDQWFAQTNVTILSFFKRWDLNYEWSMPSFEVRSNAAQERELARLRQDFDLGYTQGTFLLLVRKGASTPAR
jgi:hypothetical protein